jgi:hypothetical protein
VLRNCVKRHRLANPGTKLKKTKIFARLSLAAATILAVVIATTTTEDQAEMPTQEVSAATSGIRSVFYSGLGCAGLAQAGAASRRLREQASPCIPALSGGTGTYNGRWTSSTSCDPSHATYPATIAGAKVTQLVGFSLGRLGPLYLLRSSASLASAVDSIVMLDPGSSEITGNHCDTGFDSAKNIQKWLDENPGRKLTIIAGPDTQVADFNGIKKVYLSELSKKTNGQVLVCSTNLDHATVMDRYGPILINHPSPTECPTDSHRADISASTSSSTQAPTATSRSTTPAPRATTASPTTPPLATSPPTTQKPHTDNSTYPETVGGPTATWSNFTNAGGLQGATIPTSQTVGISCVITGFAVQNGNTNWYRIHDSPWSDQYYASADAFYNNGATSGSLRGTPFADPAVPRC